ncbi:MAG: endonuclease domain-containing protein [Acidimicrobiales bacterium]
MTPAPAPADRFVYDRYALDTHLGQLTCHYRVGRRRFSEQFTFGPSGDWGSRAVDAAARIVFLLAGVSYFKTSAPPVVDLGDLATTADERRFLRRFYVEGLAEFAYRNGLDLSGLEVTGPELERREPVGCSGDPGRPLVPFGGGIDSIVTTEIVRRRHPRAVLLVVNRPGDRFEAIERPAAVTGLPVSRVEREVDPAVIRSSELGFLNGHVPVTGIISAVAVMAAVVGGHGAVVMSNEWSASIGNLVVDGRPVNHQWSKSLAFEQELRRLLAATFGPGIDYYSLLRPYSELWVARQFAALEQYHRVFRSCNRAFHIDRGRRLDHWCGTCDKCCFIDLVLAPFLTPAELARVFDGLEPLANPALESRFRALLGNWPGAKPFECVGDVDECRAALSLAAARPDRAGTSLLHKLAAEVGPVVVDPVALLGSMGEHFIPDGDTPQDQLV